MTVYLNGQFLPPEQAKISVLDRGFLFGDGIYEVWRVVDGALFEHERHVRRLRDGLTAIEIQVGSKEIDALPAVAERLLRENSLVSGEATFYLEITRGAAPRTHAYPPAGTAPTIFAMVNRLTIPPAQLEAGAAAITQPDTRWMRCDVKTVQLLANCMAKQKAQAAGAIEAIFVRDGVVTEGTHTAVLGVKGGELRMHPLSPLILPSVTREVVIEIAKAQGIAVREAPFTASDMFELEELFITGTTSDVTPIVAVDGRRIASGKPGPISKQLYAGLRARLDAGRAAARR